MITVGRLKEILSYDPQTGNFVWLEHRGRVNKGDIAGTINHAGYVAINTHGKRYMAHVLAWLYMTGEWPENCMDHKNGVRTDNRFENLRPATYSENNCNRKFTGSRSGVKGVTWHSIGKKWQARIKVNRIEIHLGLFDNIGDASAAYWKAARHYFGEFARAA